MPEGGCWRQYAELDYGTKPVAFCGVEWAQVAAVLQGGMTAPPVSQ